MTHLFVIVFRCDGVQPQVKEYNQPTKQGEKNQRRKDEGKNRGKKTLTATKRERGGSCIVPSMTPLKRKKKKKKRDVCDFGAQLSFVFCV
jgi:hypothetical protein